MNALRAPLAGIMISVLIVAGCPWLPHEENPQYTSANLNSHYRNVAGDLLAPGMEPEYMEDTSGATERELVEPDVIRREGDRLFVLNQYRGLIIVDLASEAILSQTPTYGHPRDLYLEGDRAYVLVSYARDIKVEEGIIGISYGSKLYVLNVEDPVDVVVEGAFSFDGDLVDSRLVGNVIYAVCSNYTWYEGSAEGVVSTEGINKSYGTTGAVSINIANPDHIYQVDTESFDGYGNLIQATNYAIFVAANDYTNNNSVITYVDISDPEGQITIRGFTAAPGYMADRFKMDAWNGTLRVVTNTWWPDRQTLISTFDITAPDAIVPLGNTTLANASGETLYATRFDGPLAYVVTYLTVDPLFVIDLRDPTAPVVAGELKIPGWSTHIEPRGDRLIALGVDDQDGRRVMISLFDVGNPAAPQRLDYASFGEGWSWSSAYDDVKALTVLDDRILVPFSGWHESTGSGYDRLQFIAYNREALDVQGYVDVQGSVVRSFEYADRCYAVTQEELAVIDAGNASTPVVENTLVLAENVTDILPLSNGWNVEIISRHNAGDTLLRAKDYDTGNEAGTISIPAASSCDAFSWNNGVVLVVPVHQYEPEYRAYYRAWLVDFTDAAAPTVAGEWIADIEPLWNGWWWGRAVMPLDDALEAPQPSIDAKSMPYYPYYTNTVTTSFLVGDYLVLRGTQTGRDWWAIGSGESRETLAVIDLAGADDLRYVDLGLQHVHSMRAVETRLYITSYEETTTEVDGNPYCAYYLQTLNPFNLERGPRINVPGVFMHRVPETGHLVLEDQQYRQNGGTRILLRSVTLSEDSAVLVDSVEFNEGSWEYTASGPDVFFAGIPYSNGYYDYDLPAESEVNGVSVAVHAESEQRYYKAGLYTLSSAGIFEPVDSCPVSASWCSLLGARNRQVYLRISDAVIVRYDFRHTPPIIAETVPTMSAASGIRFTDDAAYIPLGYSGVAMMK